MKQLAIIRIRGTTGIEKSIADTLDMLGLKAKNNCVIVPRNTTYLGMIKKVNDYVTWGEVTDEALAKMKQARGETKIIKGEKVESAVYRLHPPRGGYARKGIKKNFSIGGALGYRGEKINLIIQKML